MRHYKVFISQDITKLATTWGVEEGISPSYDRFIRWRQIIQQECWCVSCRMCDQAACCLQCLHHSMMFTGGLLHPPFVLTWQLSGAVTVLVCKLKTETKTTKTKPAHNNFLCVISAHSRGFSVRSTSVLAGSSECWQRKKREKHVRAALTTSFGMIAHICCAA